MTVSPDQLAARFVTLDPCVPGACHHVYLDAPGVERIALGPYQNPAVTRERMGELRAFAAAVIRATLEEADLSSPEPSLCGQS